MASNKSVLSYLYNHNYNTIDSSNFVLPTTSDFNSTELPYKFTQTAGYDGDFTKMLYFIEKPYSENPGYYSDDEIIIVKGKPILTGEYLGNFDADTVYFPIDEIDDNDAMVSYNGSLFTIKDYLRYASSSFGNNAQVGVRFVGIDAPETHKYKIILASVADSEAKHYSKAEINKSKNSFLYDELSDDYMNDTMYFIKRTIDGITYYCQLTNAEEEKFGPIEDDSGNITYNEQTVRKYLYKTADANDNKISHAMTQTMIDLIGDNEVVMMLDHNMLNTRSGTYPTTYDQYDESLLGMIKQYIGGLYFENNGPKYTGFSGFGQDGYGRFLGCLYVKTKIPNLPEELQEKIGEQWINVTKYLLYHYGPAGIINQELALSFNDYSPTHVANYNFASSAFRVWTYDNRNNRIEDLLDNVSFDSITRQREIQKQVLGFDFDTQLKDWTVMIGDYACIVPPTSIRCVTRNSAESVPLIRSRGSAMKETPQSERLVEMSLYFAEEAGINGIEIEIPVIENGETRRLDEYTLAPTGETIKYYMNGLRALISMFKLCPFLPITNTYINDTLNIDAVALEGLYISTVPGYSKLISARIQLREFNYHAYMSEIPLTGNESAETIMYTNMFEKCIDYDALRYYYQKPIYRGECAAKYSFDSHEYLEATYGTKTALQPMFFKDSSIEFYIPDNNYLNKLLEVKLAAISNPIKTQYKITDDVKEWAAELGKIYPYITDLISGDEYKEYSNFINNGPYDKNGNYIFTIKDVKNDAAGITALYENIGYYNSAKYENIYKIYNNSGISSYTDIFNEEWNGSKYQFSKYNAYWSNNFNNNTSLYWIIDDPLQPDKFFTLDNDLQIIMPVYLSPSEYANYIVNDANEYIMQSYIDSDYLYFNTYKFIETNTSNIINFLKNISIDLEENYTEYFDDGYIKLPIWNISDSSAYKLIQYCYAYYTIGSDNNNQFELPSDSMQSTVMDIKEDIDLDSEDSFKFIKYPNDSLMESAIVTNISASFNNNLSSTYLKAIDGYAPQYLGGQDTIIELTLQTQDEATVSALNLLPKLCAEYVRNYRLILSCCPLRINTDLTRMLGVNEVMIESVDVFNVDGYPGLYNINIRLIAMDRTVRNKEALKRLDVNNAGSRTIASTQSFCTRDYFSLKDKISAAEIYPDLELPTINELDAYGFTYIKYKILDTNRAYPDPDFYFVYGATTTNKILRDSILNNLEEKNDQTFTMADYLGAQFDVNIAQDGNEQLLSVSNENYTAKAEAEASNTIEQIKQKFQNAIYTIKSQSTSINTNGGYNLSRSTIEDLYNFINIVGNLQSNDYWNFSSSAKGLYRSFMSYIDDDNECFNYFDNYIKQASQHITNIISGIDYFNLYRDYYDEYDNILDNSLIINKKFSNKSIETINDTYRNRIFNKIRDILTANREESLPIFYGINYISNGNTLNRTIALSNSSIYSILAIADSFTGFESYQDIDNKNSDGWKLSSFVQHNGSIYPLIDKQFKTIEAKDAIESATSFGPFKIQQYNGAYIKKYFGINYFDQYIDHSSLTERQEHMSDIEKMNLFIDDDKYYFLNPTIINAQIRYYKNNNTDDKRTIDGYKLGLLYDYEIMASEIIINLLVIYHMLICKNILVSEIQAITYEQLYQVGTNQIHNILQNEKTETVYTNSKYTVFSAEKNKDIDATKEVRCTESVLNQLLEAQASLDSVKDSMSDEDLQELQEDLSDFAKSLFDDSTATTDAQNIISTMTDLYGKLVRGNLLTAEIVYINGFNNTLMEHIENRDYTVLNDMLHSAQLSLNSTNNIFTYKYLLALAGREVIKSIEDLGASDNAISTIATGIIDDKFRIQQESQPYTYTRDSFYDMITNDMRGRMARAYPTFYMLFVDEGREIGLWKLNDNFYNMSSISEITITKSRKIAADTCTVSMTNMFKTFTTDDEDGKEMAYDLETLSSIDSSFSEMWDSIFSPRKLFLKEYQERLEQNPIERAQLRPGVRMHVRMGYGGDAYSLPIVFNGVVAQVSTGEYINIVCQGDGVELSNPINYGITYSEDITNYSDIPIVKQIANWATTGATPKTILNGFLATKGTWLKETVRQLTSGRFFNGNPFGITHFGDPDYKNIFNNSECSQNIYEAYNSATFNGDSADAVTYMQYQYATSDAPKVSTQIIDKSYWDLMHVMAGVAPDYIASVAPFCMRSTIFYGLPHYYYAYEYVKDSTGRIKEKRKPFQQYHTYTSYSDIIENNISTSSEFMKTNAVGLYYTKGFAGNMSTSRVGPIYTDIDIYSEYQKSMTVDTTFVSQYHGALSALGSIVPYLNKIIDDANLLSFAGIDNEQIAWRITARSLKDSVKEMYQGELITIGDPSVKPYDIIYLYDVYENMQGGCEVEAVTHILNSQTGFTSSIYVDPMIDIDNRYYQTAHSLTVGTLSKSIIATAATIGASMALSRNSQPITKMAAKLIAKGTDRLSSSVSDILSFLSLDDDTTRKVSSFIKGTNVFANLSATYQCEKLSEYAYTISKIDFNKLKNLSDSSQLDSFLDIVKSISSIDETTIINLTSTEKATNSVYKDIYAYITNKATVIANNKTPAVQDAITAISNKLFASQGLATLSKNDTNIADAMVLIGKAKDADFTQPGIVQKYIDAIKLLSSSDEAADVITDIAKNSDDIIKTFTAHTDDIVKAAKALNIDDIAKATKVGDKVADAADVTQALSNISYVASTSKGAIALSTIIGAVVEFAAEVIITGTLRNYIYRELRNLEALRIYPLTKNGKVYTAGLNGSRGIVVGSSTFNKQGWLQTFLSDFIGNPIVTAVGSVLLGDISNYNTILDSWKRSNNMTESDSDIDSAYSEVINLLSSVSNGITNYNNMLSNRILLDRISTLTDNNDSTETSKALSMFSKLYVDDGETLEYNPRLSELQPISYLVESLENIGIPSDTLTYYHTTNSTDKIQIMYNNNVLTVPYYNSVSTYPELMDIAMLSYDCNMILNNLIQYYIPKEYNNYLNQKGEYVNISIVNALIPGYGSSWLSTGYSVNFYINNMEHNTFLMLLDMQKEACNNIFEYSYITQEDGSILYNISVYPVYIES